jgi:hypothetical protein
MNHPVILNIGMRCADGAELTTAVVMQSLRAAGVLWERIALREDAPEPTMVVEGYSTDYQVYLLSTWLQQECIAVWDQMHREGRLVGPQAAKWGEFDPAQFILLNGSLLSEARSVVA